MIRELSIFAFCHAGIRCGRLPGFAKKAKTSSTGNGVHWLVLKVCVIPG